MRIITRNVIAKLPRPAKAEVAEAGDAKLRYNEPTLLLARVGQWSSLPYLH